MYRCSLWSVRMAARCRAGAMELAVSSVCVNISLSRGVQLLGRLNIEHLFVASGCIRCWLGPECVWFSRAITCAANGARRPRR